MSPREELMIAAVVALLVGYALGEKKRQVTDASAASKYDPLGWLNQYTTA